MSSLTFCINCKLPHTERDAAVKRCVHFLVRAPISIPDKATFSLQMSVLFTHQRELAAASGVSEGAYGCCVQEALETCDYDALAAAPA